MMMSSIFPPLDSPALQRSLSNAADALRTALLLIARAIALVLHEEPHFADASWCTLVKLQSKTGAHYCAGESCFVICLFDTV